MASGSDLVQSNVVYLTTVAGSLLTGAALIRHLLVLTWATRISKQHPIAS